MIESIKSVAWPLIACLVAAVAIDGLHRSDDSSRELIGEAAGIRTAALRLDLLTSDALPSKQRTTHALTEASGLLIALHDRLNEAKAGGLSDEDAKPLAEAVGQLDGTMRTEFDLIRQNRMAEALAFDNSSVDPVLARLEDRLGVAQTRVHNVAAVADRAAKVVTYASMAFCMALVVFFTHRQRSRSRREEAGRLDALRVAEEANKAKNDFLSRMSHELRTPMNAILGFGQLLQMDPLDDEQSIAVDHILMAGKHLLVLINEVLDISRIEAGTMSVSCEAVSTKELVEECVSLVAPLAEARSIMVKTSLIDGANTHVNADKQRFRQCLINLLSNAIKYNNREGVVEVTSRFVGDVWRLEVRDTGNGIPKQALNRLFVPFDRLGAEVTKTEGTGLGLALSQRMASQMGGRLDLAETSREGSTFFIELPKAEAPAISELTEEYPRLQVASETPKKVLYVEDNASNQFLMEKLFERFPGFQLSTCVNGFEGIRLAQVEAPDLVLLDIHLPDVDGAEVLTRLRSDARTAEIPIIVLSADASPGQIDRLMQNGAQAYLTKPIDSKGLLRTMADVLAGNAVQAAA